MVAVLADDLDPAGGSIIDDGIIGQVRRVRTAHQLALDPLAHEIDEIPGPALLLRALAKRGLARTVLACDLPYRKLSRAVLPLDGFPIRSPRRFLKEPLQKSTI